MKIDKSSGTLTLDASNEIGVRGDWLHTQGNVDATGSTVVLTGPEHRTVITGSDSDERMAFDNFTLDLSGNYNLGGSSYVAVDGTLTIAAVGSINGTIATRGDVVTQDTAVGGDGYIVFRGTGDQSLTAEESGAQVPGVKIDKSSGTLTLDASNEIGVRGDWLHTQGNVDATGSTVVLTGPEHRTVITGSDSDERMAFDNFTLDLSGNYNLGGSSYVAVDGTLTIAAVGSINGTIVARGDVTTEDTGVGGDGLLIFSGNQSQTLKSTVDSNIDHGQIPAVRIDKTGGTLTLDDSETIGVNGGWNYVKGGLNAAGSTISFEGTGHRTVNTGPNPNSALYNVEIDTGNYNVTATRLDVNGSLTIHSVGSINGAAGAVTVARDLTSNDSSVGGSADITMDGNIDAAITGGDFPNGGIVLQKGSAQNVTANVTQSLDGLLTIKSLDRLNGTFHVGKNVVTSDTGVRGNGVLVFSGTGNQKLTATVQGAQVPGVEINKASGTFTVDSANLIGVTGSEGWNEVAGNVVTTGTTVEFSGVSKSVNAATPFNDVVLRLGSGDTLTATNMTVNGDLTIASGHTINGTITARGDVTTGSTGVYGSGTILFNGTGAQTLSASVNGGQVPNVEINKSSGTLTVDASNEIRVYRSWTHVDGDVVTTDSTVRFVGGDKTIDDGGYAFNDVILNMGSANVLTATSMTVGGDLTITSLYGINGQIDVHGNVTSTDNSVFGNGVIRMVGSNDAMLSGGDLPNGGLVVDKTTVGNSVSLGAGLSALSSLAVNSGTLNFGTNVLTVNGATSVGASGTLAFSLMPGTTQLKVTSGGLTFASGSRIVILGGGDSTFDYDLISVTGGGSLVNDGVVFTLPSEVTSEVTTGANGKVRILKS